MPIVAHSWARAALVLALGTIPWVVRGADADLAQASISAQNERNRQEEIARLTVCFFRGMVRA